jgi:FkbM family methyltransferase
MGFTEYLPTSFKREIVNWLKFLKGEKNIKEIQLSHLPRFKRGFTNLIKPNIEYVDSASLLSAYREIFKKEIYDFKCDGNPRIIDCGANIGLAIIYWKRKFPDAEIIGFEPDPEIFRVLKKNIRKQDYSDVSLYKKGVYIRDDTLKFYQEGADGGHLVNNDESDGNNFIAVPVTDLKKYLNKPVDMLKIDIEGSEVDVIPDCEENLRNVKNLFVEFHSFVDQEQRLSEILRSLKKAGFRYHLQPELVAKRPFIDQVEDNGMDNRVNIFAYR